ncbi:MAG TPA: NosD domain-containing protein, partial [Acidobacteriota bacterium]|nr:NosD domain-containing protein [Acidobacteriota bacterium]
MPIITNRKKGFLFACKVGIVLPQVIRTDITSMINGVPLSRKLVLIIVFLLLCNSSVISFSVISTVKVCFAQQQGPIYIHADGSIDPPTAPISTVDNITFTLTGDIFNESIVVEKNNTVVDGAFHTVEGTMSSQGGGGVSVSESTNVTIENFIVREASIRINPYSSHVTIFENTIIDDVYSIGYSFTVTNAQNNTICGNNITDNGGGIFLYNSRGDRIFGNNIIGNGAWGISIGYYSSNNTIYGNNIKNNFSGIILDSSSNNNVVYHNNFANNYSQLGTPFGSANIWDNGFEGNYWSDYNGTDSNQDGIGDTPYVIEANNTDHCPLMGPFQSFN